MLLVAVLLLALGLISQPAYGAEVDSYVAGKYITSELNKKPVEWEDELKPQLARRDEQIRLEEERKAREAAEAARKAEEARLARIAAVAARVAPYGSYGNGYSWGNCTFYVASRIQVPGNLGNANTWDDYLGASAEPMVGAIAQTDMGWAGHVAIVEGIDGGSVLISEMNYVGYNTISQRWAPISEFKYIY